MRLQRPRQWRAAGSCSQQVACRAMLLFLLLLLLAGTCRTQGGCHCMTAMRQLPLLPGCLYRDAASSSASLRSGCNMQAST